MKLNIQKGLSGCTKSVLWAVANVKSNVCQFHCCHLISGKISQKRQQNSSTDKISYRIFASFDRIACRCLVIEKTPY